MAFDRATAEIPESVKARGMVDRATGIERAHASRQWLKDAAWDALNRTDQLQNSHFVVRHPREARPINWAQRGGLASGGKLSPDAEATFHCAIMHAW